MISPVPDVKTLKIDPKSDTFMVLACDGIWNSMSSQEVVDFVGERIKKNPQKLSSICEEVGRLYQGSCVY
jgi:protein phosphatase 1G